MRIRKPDIRAGMLSRVSAESAIVFWIGFSALLLPYVTFEPAAVDATLLIAASIYLYKGGKFSESDLILALVYLGSFFLSALASEIFGRANEIKFARYLYVETYLFFVVVVTYRIFVTYPKAAWVFMKYYCIGAVVSCSIIAVIYHAMPGIDSIWRDGDHVRIKGFFKDPNVLGPYLIFPGLALLFNPRLVGLSSKWRLGFFPIAYVIFLTFSRATLGSFLASAGLLFFLRFVRGMSIQKYFLTNIAVVAVLILLFFKLDSLIGFLSGLENFSQRMTLQSYDNDRFSDIFHALGLGLESPLGLGPASYESMFDSLSPHNLFVAKLVDGGWAPAFLITWFGTYPAWICFRKYVKDHEEIYLILFCTMTAHVMMSQIINSHHWRHFLLMCCAIFAMNITSKSEKSSPRRNFEVSRMSRGSRRRTSADYALSMTDRSNKPKFS